jgi:hypothetical protein
MAWRRMTRKGARPLGLPELLAALGAELREAHATAEREGKETAAWTSATVEIDVAVEVSAGGGVEFYVTAEGAAARTRTTKIILNLEPVDVVPVRKPSEKADVVPVPKASEKPDGGGGDSSEESELLRLQRAHIVLH